MQRILLLIPSMAGVGGTERMVHSLSLLLSKAGFEVAQASFDAPGISRHFDSACPLHALGPVPRLPIMLRPLSYTYAAWRLRCLKRKLRTQITISNLWSADLINALSGGNDKKVALCHTNIVGNPANRLMIRLLPVVAAVYRRFDRVIAVTESLAQELKVLYRLDEDKASHIDNFVDQGSAGPSARPNQRLSFVWCGRFSTEKNLSGLLHAWAEVAKLRHGLQLILLGDGPQFAEMQQLARLLGVNSCTADGQIKSHVVFLGRVQDPSAYLDGARALLLSSVAEGLPMVVLEALALGTPVLASDCEAGGVRKALLGSGDCQPHRATIELTSAGCLLPIPDASIPSTLRCWREAILAAIDDDELNSNWRKGALIRAREFGPEAATNRWKAALTFEVNA